MTPVEVEKRAEALDVGSSGGGRGRRAGRRAGRWSSSSCPSSRRRGPLADAADDHCPARRRRHRRGGASSSVTSCPSTSATSPRSTGRRWRRGPPRCSPGAGREGAGDRRQRHARQGDGPGAGRPRRRGDGAAAAASGLACREVLGDVSDPSAVGRAVEGQEVVVHLAAKVDVVGPWSEYEQANVVGTRTLVEACRTGSPFRLVHVSSPSVAHAGDALVGAGAGPADPDGARGHYARSKAMAEQIALAADGGPPGGAGDPAAPGLGSRRHPAGRPHRRAGPRRPPAADRHGRSADRHDLRRQRSVGAGGRGRRVDGTRRGPGRDQRRAAAGRRDPGPALRCRRRAGPAGTRASAGGRAPPGRSSRRPGDCSGAATPRR